MGRAVLLGTQHFQHSQFRAVHALFVQVFAVAQLVGHKPHGVVRRHPGQAGQAVSYIGHGGADARADAVLVQQGCPAALAVLPRLAAGVQRLHLCDRHAKFVVAAQKNICVGGAGSQRKDIRHIPHDFVGEKRGVDVFAAIGHAPALAQVDDGQGALVVAEQHGGFCLAVLRRLKQKRQLIGTAAHRDDLQRFACALRGLYRFGAAITIAGHKEVGRVQNRFP